MRLAEISINRPVFATMINIVLIVFGLFSLPRLAVDQYPKIDFPVVTVSVVYPGADPASVEQRILKPLEDAVNGIAGLDKLSSTAYPSVAQLVLAFKLEKNADQAAQEVRDKISGAVGRLPGEAESPIVQKFDIGGAPIINVALTGEGVPYAQLSEIAKDVIQPALERVDGVAAINAAGIRQRQVQLFVDREKLAGFGLTPNDIIESVRQQNLDLPAGKIQNETQYFSLRVKGRLANGEEIGRLPVLSATNPNLRISDVATVRDLIAEETTASFIGRTPTILMSIQKQASANTTAVADQSRAAILKLAKQMPAGAKLEIVSDNSKYIKGSIDSVKLDLLLGAVLATFIVLVFLRDMRITFISAVALPTAVIATFAFLEKMGFTLNMMTTLALSLSIGILIDDAIIVIENIHRHLGMGKSGPEAARDATAEIGLAVIATTLTICAVFVPVAFMEGMMGRFFYEFGLTVAFAVIVSLFVAFTFTPMLASRLLKEGDHKPRQRQLAWMYDKIESILTRIDDLYRAILSWCLDHRMITLGAGAALFGLSIVMLKFVPVAFFPKEDKSQFSISYTLPEGTTLAVTKNKSLELSDALAKYPGIEKIVTAIAATRDAKPNKARFDVILTTKEHRTFSQFQLIERLRSELQPLYAKDGAEVTIQEQEGGGGGGRTEPIQLIFRSDNWPELVLFTDKVAAYIKANIKDTVDVSTSKPKVQREFRIEIDPARAADLAVTTAQIGATVRALYEGDKISEVDDKGSSFDVRMRIDDKDRVSAEDLSGVTIINRRGQQITLGSIARIVPSDAPSVIERFDGQRQITVVSNFKGKDLNAVVNLIQQYVTENLPPDINMGL
jgi:HAE1 family hydrophobic/amphiphilic exporter-1